MFGQKKTGDFPSKRFDESRICIIVHLITGIILIYSGVCFQFLGVFSTPLQEGHPFYFVFAASGIIHSITVTIISPKVMGERRITFPLYVSAGIVNFVNSILLILYPNIKHAFLLWGSVNTFIFVRLHVVLFMFSKIDWELNYTYSIIAAASVSYPMSNQGKWVYLLPIAPLFYGPFHERVCHRMGWEIEDVLGGNQPAKKNIRASTSKLRASLRLSVRTFDKDDLMRDDDKSDDDARDGDGTSCQQVAANISEEESYEDGKPQQRFLRMGRSFMGTSMRALEMLSSNGDEADKSNANPAGQHGKSHTSTEMLMIGEKDEDDSTV